MASYFSGVEIENIREMISMYTGVGRRFEHKGYTEAGARVIDDYAHHPTEIKATLKAVRNMNYDKVWAIFQPHTFTRTESLLDEFAKSFDDADVIIVPDIYASRERFTDRISSKDLAREIIKNTENKEVYQIGSFDCIADLLKSAGEKDVILTIGAGDVYKIAEMITV